MKKTGFLLLYILPLISLSVLLWGLGLWEFENIISVVLLLVIQIVMMYLIFKYRESTDSVTNYLLVVPSVFIMLLVIQNTLIPTPVAALVSLTVLIPIYFLDKYIKRIFIDE